MSDATPTESSASTVMRAPAYIGPLISQEFWPLRYVAAVVVVLLTVTLRAALAPMLGTQAPLLPFVLAVFVSAYLGGRGPGLLASVLTPLAATIWFTTWPHDAPAAQWLAHVAFFLLIAGLATQLMHELQTRALGQLLAGRAAAESAQRAVESAAQLRLIADSMPVLISYIDVDGIYRFANRMYDSWFGMTSGRLVGRAVSDVIGPTAYELIRPRLQRALKGERVFFEQELAYGNVWREVAIHYIPDFDATGMVRGCFALIEDVAPRKRAERSLREADRRKDEFLAILAHELRNPLTPIRNLAHILKGDPDAATVRRSGEMLERQATLLTHLVDDLLDVSHIIRGRVALRRESLNLVSVVETALESVRPTLELRGQRVSVERGDTELFVHGDRVRLCQVVSNLLTNASKYSPPASRIDVMLEANGGNAVLRIRDQGIGIDPQMLPHVFDVFLQGDRSLDRSQDGLGIGLTIVKSLVDMHGGSVQARSEGLGKGSEFRILLPRAAAPAERAPPQGATPGPPTARRKVLVVEDNRDAAESMRELLRMSGHEVEVAHDGASALVRLEDFHADVVVLDIGLPRMDGFMVAHAIRARFAPAQSRPRLLALTGHAGDVHRHTALRAGFDGHLTKPIEPDYLLRLIAEQGQWQLAANDHSS